MSELSSDRDERPKIAEHYCITSLKEASTSMQWTISDFDLLRMDGNHYLESSSFESVSDGIHTGTWKMKLAPNFSKKETIGLFFTFSGNMANTFAEFEASLIDEDGKETNKMQRSCELIHNDHGFDEFIKKDMLVDSLLPDGFLTIRGDITVIHMNSSQTKSGQLDTGNSLSRDFSKLMKEEILKDAVIICGDREFPIHKCILSARSSVFSAMFTGEWKEKNSVEIKDMEVDILENLLSYIYTDNILDFTTVNTAIKLLEAADRYGLLELKGICKDYLEKNISIQNLFEVAAAAELHNLDSLKMACITFMFEHGKDIVLSNHFKGFHTTAPQYLLEGVLKQHFGVDTTQKAKFSSSISQTTPSFATQTTPSSATQATPSFATQTTKSFATQDSPSFATQATPSFATQATPSFATQASSIFTREVTSCPSCGPSLHHCTSAAGLQVPLAEPLGFGLPSPAFKLPIFDFGQVPK